MLEILVFCYPYHHFLILISAGCKNAVKRAISYRTAKIIAVLSAQEIILSKKSFITSISMTVTAGHTTVYQPKVASRSEWQHEASWVSDIKEWIGYCSNVLCVIVWFPLLKLVIATGIMIRRTYSIFVLVFKEALISSQNTITMETVCYCKYTSTYCCASSRRVIKSGLEIPRHSSPSYMPISALRLLPHLPCWHF